MTPERLNRLGLATSAGVALGITYFALMPGEALPPAPGSDKVQHLVAFAALLLPTVAARPRNALWAVPLAVGYGGVIELVQTQVGRHGEWADVLANAAGALLGAGLGWGLHRLARRVRRRR